MLKGSGSLGLIAVRLSIRQTPDMTAPTFNASVQTCMVALAENSIVLFSFALVEEKS